MRSYPSNNLRSFIKRYGIPFVIQDDDVNYFTQVKLIENIYGRPIKNLGFKVSFAVIPFVKDIKESYIPRKGRYSGNYFPITMNKNLCKYLAKSKNISIALHGYSHDEVPGTSEFVNLKAEQILMRISRAKILLEHTFNIKLKCFVPPHHYVNRHVIAILNKLGLILFTNIHKLLRSNLFSLADVFPNLRLASLIKHILFYVFIGEVKEHKICDLVKPFSIPQLAYFDYLLNDILTSKTNVEDVDPELLAKCISTRLAEKVAHMNPFIVVFANHHWMTSKTFIIKVLEYTLEQIYDSIPLHPMKMDEIVELLMGG